MSNNNNRMIFIFLLFIWIHCSLDWRQLDWDIYIYIKNISKEQNIPVDSMKVTISLQIEINHRMKNNDHTRFL